MGEELGKDRTSRKSLTENALLLAASRRMILAVGRWESNSLVTLGFLIIRMILTYIWDWEFI